MGRFDERLREKQEARKKQARPFRDFFEGLRMRVRGSSFFCWEWLKEARTARGGRLLRRWGRAFEGDI